MDISDIVIQIAITFGGLALTLLGALTLYRYYLVPKVIFGVKNELSDILGKYVDNKIDTLTASLRETLVISISDTINEKTNGLINKTKGKVGSTERWANAIVNALVDGKTPPNASSEAFDRAREILGGKSSEIQESDVGKSIRNE